MKPRKPLRKISPKGQSRRRVYSVIAKTFKLEHPLCEACKRIDATSDRQFTTDIHHTRGKVGDLLFATQYFMAVCRSCHNWIGDHPQGALDHGLICQRGDWNKQPPSVCVHHKLLTEPCSECTETWKTISGTSAGELNHNKTV